MRRRPNQYIAQLSPTVREAVFGNVGTLVAFRVGLADAEHLHGEFGEEFHERQFVDLPRYETLIRNQSASGSIHFQRTRLSPPIETHQGRKAKLLRRSRERFAPPASRLVSAASQIVLPPTHTVPPTTRIVLATLEIVVPTRPLVPPTGKIVLFTLQLEPPTLDFAQKTQISVPPAIEIVLKTLKSLFSPQRTMSES